ncbi:Uncharacterised protein [Vibrio cholerae]|nr:Uncharacterised protein [Vibrio cholerae]
MRASAISVGSLCVALPAVSVTVTQPAKAMMSPKPNTFFIHPSR